MKKIIIIALVCLVLLSQPAAIALVCVVAVWAAFFWVLKKIGILSAPQRMSKAAGNSVNNFYRRKRLEEMIRKELRR